MTRDAGESALSTMLGASAPVAERAAVRAILRGCPGIALDPGDVLSTAGSEVALVLVESGLVVVRAAVSGRKDVVLADAGEGGLVSLGPGCGEVQALAAARLRLLAPASRDELLALPAAATFVAEALETALADSFDAAGVLAASPARARIERKLVLLARRYGRVVRDGVRLDFPLTHELLGDMTGTARETVTRVLDVLERDGFLGRDGRTYRLLVAPDAL